MSDLDSPRPLSPDEVDQLKKYRDLAMPAARLAGLDDFAKWLFTSISVIGSLGAAFSSSALKEFTPCGAALFFIALLLTGISLFLAVCLRAIEPRGANWQSLLDMIAKDEEALRTKQKLATASGAAFALAVLVAGAAPLFSLVCRPAVQNTLAYSVGKDGVHASVNYAQAAGSTGELRIVSDAPGKETLVAAQRGVATSGGAVKLDAAGALPADSTGFRIILTCDGARAAQQSVSVALSGPPGKMSGSDKLTPETGCGQ
jgi:hypothetical protein